MRAASGSCAVARMARPMRLRRVNAHSAAISTDETIQMRTSRSRSTAPPSAQVSGGSGSG